MEVSANLRKISVISLGYMVTIQPIATHLDPNEHEAMH